MWYAPTVTVPPASEPITLAAAKNQCRIVDTDTSFDSELTGYIAAARDHVERYTGTPLVTRTVTINADRFADLAHIPVVPLQSVTSIAYVDTAGAAQTLSASIYEVRSDGLAASAVLKPGQVWPAVLNGSRVTLTAVVGYSAVPDAIVHAVRLLVADYFADHEVKADRAWSTLDSLLCNYRRGAS